MKNHKIDCICGICKAIRGETKGVKKSKEHIKNWRNSIANNKNWGFKMC